MPYKEGNFLVYLFAEDGTEAYDRGFVQNFQTIVRERIEALGLFEDEHFTIDKCFKSKLLPTSEQWKRPRDIDKRARFFVREGSGKCSVPIGDEGSGWIATAIGAVAQNFNLLKMVVPKDQTLNPVGYAGIFHFRFWFYDKWVDVVVDDYLPLKSGELLYVQPNERSEFWAPLLEKAYAKLSGSYEAIVGARAFAIMAALTGALQETMFISDSRIEMVFRVMLRSIDKGALICASIKADTKILENHSPTEIQLGDVLYVSSVKEVIFPQNLTTAVPLGPHQLLRVRNFGSSHFYWDGPYSTTSPEWLSIPLEAKRQTGLLLEADRENWMQLEDFVHIFNRIDIFHMGLDTLMDGDDGKKRWKVVSAHGAWTKGYKAGGNIKNNSFHFNPQFLIECRGNPSAPEDDETTSKIMLVELIQKQRMSKKSYLGLNFYIFAEVEDQPVGEAMDAIFFKKARLVGSSTLSYQGQVSGRFSCPTPGSYLIVPTTIKPNEEGSFFLRVFSNAQMSIKELGGSESVGQEAESVVKVIGSRKQTKEDRTRERKAIESFNSYSDHQEELDCHGLQKVLDKFGGEPGRSLSYDTCMSLLSLYDEGTGKIGLYQLKELVNLLKIWTTHFRSSDDGKGNVRPFELYRIIEKAGFKMSNNLLRFLTIRYSKDGVLKFDDVIMCLAKITGYHKVFQAFDPNGTGKIELSQEDWFHVALTN